ncbi:hypothetical protein AAMO2058_000069100 [Amorphochlora amoebiformis]
MLASLLLPMLSGATLVTTSSRLPSRVVIPRRDVNFVRREGLKSSALVTAKPDLPPQKVISTVEKLGGTMTVSDLAAASGIPLYESQKALVNLATLTGATIDVSKEGDLVYKFPSGVRGVLLKNSAKQRLIEAWGKTMPVALYVTRVVFGLMLFASIASLTMTIAALHASTQTQQDREDDGNPYYRPSFGGNFIWIHLGPSPFDFLHYNYYSASQYRREQWEADEQRRARATRTLGISEAKRERQRIANEKRMRRGEPQIISTKEYEQMLADEEYERQYGSLSEPPPPSQGLLPAIFSYVFGDGAPQNLDQERLKLAAMTIRNSGGAVVAEQLAPYIYDPMETGDEIPKIDESCVLPLLQALNGYPEVTEKGNIVYVFPDLQTTAGVWRGPDEEYFMEPRIKFSEAPTGDQWKAGALCGLNLVLALYLGAQLAKYNAMKVALPGLLGTMQQLQPAFLTYAIALNVIPIVRATYIALRNARIEVRNAKRRRWAALLEINPDVRDRVKDAKGYSKDLRKIDDSNLIYTTSEDIDTQLDDVELNDFDTRLAEIRRAGGKYY